MEAFATSFVAQDSLQELFPQATVESVAWVEVKDDLGVWHIDLAPKGHLILGTSTKYRALLSWSMDEFTFPEETSPQYVLLERAATRCTIAEAGEGEEHPSWTLEVTDTTQRRVALRDLTTIPNSSIDHQPVDTAKWAQNGVMAWYAPGSAPCGCVATAQAQIMHALEWPVYAEGFFEADLSYTSSAGVTTTETYAFSPYSKFDYSIMDDVLADYQNRLLGNHQVARLVLLNDILAKMNFKDGGSGAVGPWAATMPWTVDPNSRKLNETNGKVSYTQEDINYIKQTMAAGVPIACTIPGHAIVASGYALYNEAPYVRLNYGWGGSSSGWYHIDDVEEYAITYPKRTVQCDPIPAVSTATPQLSWHLPKCYTTDVEGFTVTATLIPKTFSKLQTWTDNFAELSGDVAGNTKALRVNANQLQVYYPDFDTVAPKILYTWEPIFVPTKDSKWSFSYQHWYARGEVHFQVLPLGGVWETIHVIDPGTNNSQSNWISQTIDLDDYAGVPCQFRLFFYPTVYANVAYAGFVNFALREMSISQLEQVLTAKDAMEPIQVLGATTCAYTFDDGILTPGERYAFTVTPVFADSRKAAASMPCYTQIADTTTAAEGFVTMTFSSPSQEAYNLSSMLFDQNTRRHCTTLGYSVIRLETTPAAAALEFHSSHPTTYPDAAFTVEKLGNGVFDIIINSAQMSTSSFVNDRLNLSVVALSEAGTRTSHELSLVFTDSSFAVSETLPNYGGNFPTELFAEVDGGEQTLESLTWTDAAGTEYDNDEIKWSYVSSTLITVSSGTLTLDGSRPLKGTLLIDHGAKVTLTEEEALTNLCVVGSGTLDCNGIFPTKRDGLLDTTWWQGTVELSGNIDLNSTTTSLEALGHEGSKLLISGTVTGYLAREKTCTVPLELNGSLTIDDGYSNTSYTFAKLTGTGTFINHRTKSGEIAYTIQFNDIEDFEGSLKINDKNINTRFVIGDLENAAPGAIVVSSGKVATLGSTAEWSAPNGVILYGTLAGSGTITGNVTFNEGSTLDVTQGALTVKGQVTGSTTVNGFGPLLKGDALTATNFQATGDSMIVSGAEGLVHTKRPSLKTDGMETVSEGAATIIAQKAAAAGLYDFTLDAGSSNPAGAELFDHVVKVTQQARNGSSGVVKVAYDFGIQAMTIQFLTTAEKVSADGLYLVVTAVVDNGDATTPAAYATGTEVQLLLDGTVLEGTTVIASEAGVVKIAVPYATFTLVAGEANAAHEFTVKAVNTP